MSKEECPKVNGTVITGDIKILSTSRRFAYLFMTWRIKLFLDIKGSLG
jgi:hypothetical protein